MTQPTVPPPFEWEGDHLRVELGGGAGLFTTRRGGVSQAPFDSLNLGWLTQDDPDAVATNHDRLAEEVGVPRASLLRGRQVHGARVRRVRALPAPAAPVTEEDGQATPLRDAAALVLVADCLPILLAADGAVAAVHGGWRGLAGGIAAEGIAALRELGAQGPVTAAIGPGAGGCCYEVGEEVHAAFDAERYDARVGERNLDLKRVARVQLEEAGAAVHDAGLCTLCGDPSLFFSHRREGGTTGRQAGVVWRA